MTDIKETLSYDDLNDTLTIKREQDVEPFVEYCKKRFNDAPEFGRYKSNMTHVARIPNIIAEKWLREEGINVFSKEDWPKVVRKLNSPEYRYLRTMPGKI